jgi:probable phosphoglycerate mutase
MKREFFFIRHGETDYNRRGIVQGSGVDSAINELGRRQAQAFYDHYKNYSFDHIICSSLRRTYETVQPFIEGQSISYERTSLINEISWGIHEGQKGSEEMILRYREMVGEWAQGNFDASLPEAESARQLSERLGRFLEYLVTLPFRRILICTHGRSLRCLLCLMKEQHLREMESYRHHNTGLFLAEFEQPHYRLILENDVTHLAKAEADGLL